MFSEVATTNAADGEGKLDMHVITWFSNWKSLRPTNGFHMWTLPSQLAHTLKFSINNKLNTGFLWCVYVHWQVWTFFLFPLELPWFLSDHNLTVLSLLPVMIEDSLSKARMYLTELECPLRVNRFMCLKSNVVPFYSQRRMYCFVLLKEHAPLNEHQRGSFSKR